MNTVFATAGRKRIEALEAELQALRSRMKPEFRRLARAERERQAALLAEAGLVVERRAGTRFWNLRDGDGLIAVTVYRIGATTAGLKLAEARAARSANNAASAQAA